MEMGSIKKHVYTQLHRDVVKFNVHSNPHTSSTKIIQEFIWNFHVLQFGFVYSPVNIHWIPRVVQDRNCKGEDTKAQQLSTFIYESV